MDVLIVNQAEVPRLLPMAECIDVDGARLRGARARRSRCCPCARSSGCPRRPAALGLMPAASSRTASLGLKAITFFPGNEGTELDSHQGAVLLFEAERGRLLAVIDATSITAIRTAAVSGVATRLLAREDAGDLAILGSGVQARTHLEAMRLVRKIRRVRVASKNPDQRAGRSPSASRRGTASRSKPCASVREAVAGADIICTTTSSREPVLAGDWISPGAHVNAVGSSVPAARELDTAAVVASRLYVDRRESALERGRRLPDPEDGGRDRRRSHRRASSARSSTGDVAGRGDRPTRSRSSSRSASRSKTSPRRSTSTRRRGLRDRTVPRVRREPPRRRLSPSSSRTSARRASAHRRLGDPHAARPPERRDAPAEIWLKLENLQPIGSFKLRGAGNAMALAPPEALARGVYTASAGNMAQGVAWNARRLGIPCTVVVPDTRPQTKLAAIERLGGHVVKVPFDRWWQVIVEHGYPGIDGLFIHPVADRAVIAGNGTIGLEILEDLPDVDAVLVPVRRRRPFLRHRRRPSGPCARQRRSSPCEVETAAPLAASLAAGSPGRSTTRRASSTASAAKRAPGDVAPRERAPRGLARRLAFDEIAAAVRLLVERHAGHRRGRRRDFRGGRARRQRRRAARSSASSPAATSTPMLATILAGEIL